MARTYICDSYTATRRRLPEYIEDGGIVYGNVGEDADISIVPGEVNIAIIPFGTTNCAYLRYTVGQCLWTKQGEFIQQFAKELFRVIRHLNAPSVVIILRHITLGGQRIQIKRNFVADQLCVFKSDDESEMQKLVSLCRTITDELMLNFIDYMSFQIKPTYVSSDVSVPTDSTPSRDLLAADSGPSRTDTAIDAVKEEIGELRKRMHEITRVPASRMNQDYTDAEAILSGEFDKFGLSSVKKAEEKPENRSGMFNTPDRSWII